MVEHKHTDTTEDFSRSSPHGSNHRHRDKRRAKEIQQRCLQEGGDAQGMALDAIVTGRDAFRKEVMPKAWPWTPSSLALEASKAELSPGIR